MNDVTGTMKGPGAMARPIFMADQCQTPCSHNTSESRKPPNAIENGVITKVARVKSGIRNKAGTPSAAIELLVQSELLLIKPINFRLLQALKIQPVVRFSNTCQPGSHSRWVLHVKQNRSVLVHGKHVTVGPVHQQPTPG